MACSKNMSNNKISLYKFKPFKFIVLEKNQDPSQIPFVRKDHRVVCNNAYLFSYGKYNSQTQHSNGHQVTTTMKELWKYSFDLGEWKKITCRNVPQELLCSSSILSGNIIIINGIQPFFSNTLIYGLGCDNPLFLGNLANEFTEKGMQFDELQVSGNIPRPLCRPDVLIHFVPNLLMDSEYIYLVGHGLKWNGIHEMDVHRFDLSNRKWELLYKSRHNVLASDNSWRHEKVFYKNRIYVFGYIESGIDIRDDYYAFSKIHVFDVVSKKWDTLPVNRDQTVPLPGCPDNRYEIGCVQCPVNPNLVYICGGRNSFYRFYNDVWRFDLDTLQWKNFTTCVMPTRPYFHSVSVTPSGRIYCFGDVDSSSSSYDVIAGIGLTNDIMCAWITIPKLKVICWEAMLHYFKKHMFRTSDENLKKIGLPQEFYERIIEARKMNVNN